MHRNLFLVGLVFLSLVVVTRTHAATWLIEPDGTGDAPNIQSGIDLASANDTILLAEGVFLGDRNCNVDFTGKAVVVISRSGPGSTVLNCLESFRGFIFQSGEGPGTQLVGVTIKDATASGSTGGAVFCTNLSSPTIKESVFESCLADHGGAIACEGGSSPLIQNNLFVRNKLTSGSSGGAILCTGEGFPVISGNTFSDNSASYGGAIACVDGNSATIQANSFDYNSADLEGGAIQADRSGPILSGNVCFENTAVHGGAIACCGPSTVGPATIQSNTLSDNSAMEGGAIYCFAQDPAIQWTIMAYSFNGEGIACFSGADPNISCSLIFGNVGGNTLCGTDGGNNLIVDPEFCGAIPTHNYWLQSDSPAATASSPCGMQIGAMDVMCGTTDAKQTSWGRVKSSYR